MWCYAEKHGRQRVIIFAHDPSIVQTWQEIHGIGDAEAKRAGDRGDYPIGAVITRVTGRREVVIANAGNRVKSSGSSISPSSWKR